MRASVSHCNTARLTNSVGMDFALVPAGVFHMGSPAAEVGRRVNEEPQHEVAITRPFYLGVYLVTQRQYETLIETQVMSPTTTTIDTRDP